jgi:hypothetical protein
MDLDTRPPQMMRSTIGLRIQHCGHCGFCSSSIDDLEEFEGLGKQDLLEAIQAEGYQRMLHDGGIPEKARHYACRAMLLDLCPDKAATSFSWLSAAWIIDDSSHPELAAPFRLIAADALQAALAGRTEIAEVATLLMVIVDVRRRAGDEKGALGALDRLPPGVDDFMLSLFEYERRLIMAGDRSCHAVSDAMG